MKRISETTQAVLLAGLALWLGGCAKHPKVVSAATTQPPKPAAPPPAPPAPLSIRQTEVQLPPPQPLTPEALATTQPEETPPAPAPPRPTPPKRTPAPVRTETPVPPPAGPPVAEPERPPVQEAVPAAELKRLQEEAQARKREVQQIIAPLNHGRLSRQQRGILDRVQTFLKQSDDAEQRGEMRQASELAQRALVLARELKP